MNLLLTKYLQADQKTIIVFGSLTEKLQNRAIKLFSIFNWHLVYAALTKTKTTGLLVRPTKTAYNKGFCASVAGQTNFS